MYIIIIVVIVFRIKKELICVGKIARSQGVRVFTLVTVLEIIMLLLGDRRIRWGKASFH